ncbi:MAG: zf-HC2 domain-containing protein [Gemmatimonadetes bacterium]|nr:zf-HC2 domain-containing protein [Gemmatimonadota bacterium]
MSTGCEFHADALADLAAGRLEADRAARVREHLATCAACREDLEVLTIVSRAEATPPEGLEDRIRAAAREVAQEGQGRTAPAVRARRPSRWRPWALPLAAAAGLATLWVGVLGRDADSDDRFEADALALAAEAPFGAWPAAGPVVAGDPVLSELSTEDLERLLEEMEP